MFCPNCGTVVNDGDKYCACCGAPVAVPASPAPEPAPQRIVKGFQRPSAKDFAQPESPSHQPSDDNPPTYEQPLYNQPANEQPAYEQPLYEQPAYEQPLYEQPAYEQPASAPVPKKRRALIAPAILAILHTVYALFGWISVLITQISSLTEYGMHGAYYGYYIFQITFTPILEIAAAVFLFLFCLVQYRKGKSSMLGVCCLLEAIAYGLGLLYSLVMAILNRNFSLSVLNVIYILLRLAIVPMLIVGMIGAFKGKVIRIVLIIAAALMILMQLTGTIYDLILYSNYVQIALFLLAILLPVALLLTAILWKPADPKPADPGYGFNRTY